MTSLSVTAGRNAGIPTSESAGMVLSAALAPVAAQLRSVSGKPPVSVSSALDSFPVPWVSSSSHGGFDLCRLPRASFPSRRLFIRTLSRAFHLPHPTVTGVDPLNLVLGQLLLHLPKQVRQLPAGQLTMHIRLTIGVDIGVRGRVRFLVNVDRARDSGGRVSAIKAIDIAAHAERSIYRSL